MSKIFSGEIMPHMSWASENLGVVGIYFLPCLSFDPI